MTCHTSHPEQESLIQRNQDGQLSLVRFANEAPKKALDDLSLPKGMSPGKFTLTT